jgi:hypothetical protein
MELEVLGLLAIAAASFALGGLAVAIWGSKPPEHAPTEPLTPLDAELPYDPAVPLAKPKHVHIWHQRSTEQTNSRTRVVYGCYECPALEVRELEAVGG